MHSSVAPFAKSDEVVHMVSSPPREIHYVMDVEVLPISAVAATILVALEGV